MRRSLYVRELLGMKAACNITSQDVVATLAELLGLRGLPEPIRWDIVPEFVSTWSQAWVGKLKLKTLCVAAGAPRTDETSQAAS